MTIDERYRNDPLFHALVNVLIQHIEEMKLTPTEIREACILAQIKYESTHVRPLVFSRELTDFIKRNS